MKAKDDPRGVAFFAVRPEVGKASSRSITLVPAGSSSAKADGATEAELRRQRIFYLPPTVNHKVECDYKVDGRWRI